jgi:microcystin-dependent protein
MSDVHYLGEITMFGGTFAPRGWAFCEGQILTVTQNPALFSILGARYGGDGRNTFSLPNLKRRFPTHPLDYFSPTPMGGKNQINLATSQLPPHNHMLLATANEGISENPSSNLLADANSRYTTNVYSNSPANIVPMHPSSISNTGQAIPIDITPPFTEVSFIICLNGIYPSRS